MARGGSRSGAGRPKGAANKRTREIANQIAENGVTPLEYLTSVYRDINAEQSKRIDAAKAAAPYVHARLNAIEMSGPDGGPIATVETIKLVGPDEDGED